MVVVNYPTRVVTIEAEGSGVPGTVRYDGHTAALQDLSTAGHELIG